MKSFWRTSFGLVLALAMMAGAAKANTAADTSLENEVEHYLAQNSGGMAGPNTFRVFWKDGLWMESGDGNFTAHIRGRMLFDMDWADSDPPAVESDDSIAENHVGFADARLGVEGTMYKNVMYKVEFSFRGGEVSFTDVYLGLKGVGGGDLMMGHMKRPFGLDELTSSRFITFTTRAPSSDAFAPGRDAGIMWARNFTETNRVWFGIGTFFNTDSTGTASGQGGWGLTLRVAGLAIENADKDMLLSVGFSLQFQDLRMDGQQVTYNVSLGSGIGFTSVTVDAQDEIRYAFEVAFKMKSLHAQAEFYWANPNAVVGDDPSFSGWYAQVGYWITGESRTFKKNGMIWDRTSPKANFWTGDGGRGALEVAIRYDGTDLSDGAFNGGENNQLGVSLNWYWNPNTRMMFCYFWNDVEVGSNDGTINVVAIRWQFDF